MQEKEQWSREQVPTFPYVASHNQSKKMVRNCYIELLRDK
jgi:hypothetical protein